MEMEIEYGADRLKVELPLPFQERGMGRVAALADPAAEIRRSYRQPLACAPLSQVAGAKLSGKAGARAVIVVSDNTRPVPYRGKNGILTPLLETLVEAGFPQDRISLLIGNGSHRSLNGRETETLYGLREAGFRIAVVNHDYGDEDNLVFIGTTRRGSPVRINRLYAEADLKIVTGLVESHFMAGASGGRKAICPAIASRETLRIFHGPEILDSPLAADLVLEGNPCSQEAEQAAQLAGCDFAVNVTLDAAKNITGIFSGDIFAAHRAAVERLREYVVVALERRYELVLIPAGFVGINHYQAAKAAIEATRALKPGGMIVLIARHSDADPIGSEDYKKTLALLKRQGPQRFLQTLKSPDWTFTHDQWETQMWGKVLEAIGTEEKLIYCSLEIPREHYELLPAAAGSSYLSDEELSSGRPPVELMKLMVERSVASAVERLRWERRDPAWVPDALLLRDGPYGVPELRSARPAGIG